MTDTIDKTNNTVTKKKNNNINIKIMPANIRFRLIKYLLFSAITGILMLATVVPLVFILFDIFEKGVRVINWQFFVSLPPATDEQGGGIANSLVGTIILIIIASLAAVPIGLLCGILIAEVRNKFTDAIKLALNIIQGVPSIVIGILIYLWIVVSMGHFSAISGGLALAVMMLPIIIQTTSETVKRIPNTLKEASFALGASYTKTIIKVILPAGFSGIASGIMLAIARVAGETAPLLFTSFGNPFMNVNPMRPTDALPLLIFNYAMSPYEHWHEIAWGASCVLITLVLLLNIISALIGKRWKTQF